MKNILFLFVFGLYFTSTAINIPATSVLNHLKETPAGTICIKHPMANDANAFFSSTKNVSFEIFKPGSKAAFVEIINKLKAVDGVENCTPGTITGDYYAVTLTLKTTKDKTWFVNAFKQAGLSTIILNKGEAISLDKL